MTNMKAYIALAVSGVILVVAGFMFAKVPTDIETKFGAIGSNPVENYIPVIKYNEGYYSELPMTTTATSTQADAVMTSSATTSVKILSTSSTQGGCIQINATSSATTARLVFTPLGATSTFAGTAYFVYGTCE